MIPTYMYVQCDDVIAPTSLVRYQNNEMRFLIWRTFLTTAPYVSNQCYYSRWILQNPDVNEHIALIGIIYLWCDYYLLHGLRCVTNVTTCPDVIMRCRHRWLLIATERATASAGHTEQLFDSMKSPHYTITTMTHCRNMIDTLLVCGLVLFR